MLDAAHADHSSRGLKLELLVFYNLKLSSSDFKILQTRVVT